MAPAKATQQRRTASPSMRQSSSAATNTNKKGTWNVPIVHLNIFLYALAYWLTSPIMPFLLKKMGAGSLSFGAFQSLFSFVQLGGGLVGGYLADHFSASTTLSITQIGSACVYASLYFATSMELLYFSRVLSIIQQSMQVGQAIISKSVSQADRAIQFGRLSLSYGSGMICGSFLSGKINEFLGIDSASIFIAVILSLAIVPINALLLSDDVSADAAAEAKKTDNDATRSSGSSNNDKKENYWSLALKLKGILIFLACLYSTRSFFEPIYNLLMLNFYKVNQSQMGEFTSYFAAIGFVANILVLPALLKVLSEKAVMRLAILLGCSGFALIASLRPENLQVFLGIFAMITFASSLLYTVSTSFVTNKIKTEASGQAIAMTHALRSAVGIFCPTAGTLLFEKFGGMDAVANGSSLAAVAGLNAVLLLVSVVLA